MVTQYVSKALGNGRLGIVHASVHRTRRCVGGRNRFLFVTIVVNTLNLSMMGIIITCAISSISSITSIQLFSEEGIIHHLGEGFYQYKILRPQVIFY